MANLAIIPARGGSKRIPRKNIKEFLGKPIIAYSIEIALKSNLFEEVIVSTDDEEIAEISRKFGANVPFLRSQKNSNDNAGTFSVIKEVLSEYESNFKKKFEFGCCIYPTAPLINSLHLKQGFDLLKKDNRITVFPVVKFSFPIWRGIEVDTTGKIKLVWPDYSETRSQDLKIVYHDAGQWYWFNINKIEETLYTQNSGALVLSEEEVQDIDNLSDWKLAELKYKLMYEA